MICNSEAALLGHAVPDLDATATATATAAASTSSAGSGKSQAAAAGREGVGGDVTFTVLFLRVLYEQLSFVPDDFFGDALSKG